MNGRRHVSEIERQAAPPSRKPTGTRFTAFSKNPK